MPSPKRVLLIEPDAMLRASLAEQFRAGGLEPVEADAADAAAQAANGIYEFALIDGTDAIALAEAFRDGGLICPILVLTEDAALAGNRDTAADEILVKPFRFAVLLARANALLKSHGRAEDAPWTVGPYQFRPNAKLLISGDRQIRLTEKEAEILSYLHRTGETVSRETLLHEVWGYNAAVDTHTLETHIYRLRRKIEQDPADARILISDNGGYRLGA